MNLEKVFLSSSERGLKLSKSKEFQSEINGFSVEIGANFIVKGIKFNVILCEPTKKGRISSKTLCVCMEVLQDFDGNINSVALVNPGKTNSVESVEFGTGLRGSIRVELHSEIHHDFIAFCSWKTLISMGIFDGDFISVDSRILQVKGQESGNFGVLYVQRFVFSNLDKETLKWKASDFDDFKKIPKAEKVTISRIQTVTTTNSIHKASFNCLLNYFREDRIYKKNDLLTIKVPKRLSEFQSKLDFNAKTWKELGEFGKDYEKVLYKIIHVQGTEESFVITEKDTKIVEKGTLFPGTILEPFKYGNIENSFSECLESKITDIFNASLHKDFKLFTSILLHGPRGSGKSYIVQKCAKKLHLDYLILNCYSILQESNQRTCIQMKSICELASKSTPCVLLLENIEAFEIEKNANDCNFFKDLISTLKNALIETGYPVLLVATTSNYVELKDSIKRNFVYTFITDVILV
jgi:hypothetical protein